ncbi:dihydrolipoyl dehydrogenase family protein [Neolewinella antarctica]|uniref:Pyruvate/2-oxoglutarate dehydrogenase complex dihydrolipoamide dehydrogenase (E3) component n=1 Tax=Neolewinella antarctica TaxID=442734 RepID=A0ABX0X6L9_9BACT|nr:NAD(P)/FAD-dependent oxidoreductase [Neolewinella antarctica]NJC24710.1 pyruvate/2-oxoglutarate dehydrogenase complex dihydrolipoamide dehydrogenase (E3) component [Neolewinella antarctica]
MKYTHDLIVIGAGAAGLGAAGFGSTIGLKAALIDKSAKNFGGDCLNYGCIPSKALLHVASQFAGAKAATDFGLRVDGKADFKKVMAYVHQQQDVIRALETPEQFAKNYGTDTIVGTAELTGDREVTVNGRKLTARKIVLATGSVPRQLDVPGADLVKQWDNESIFWELEELPEKLLIVGGGPISCELSQAFARLGSQVTLLVRGERILDKDPDIMGNILAERLRHDGVDIQFETEVASFTSATQAELKHGKSLEFSHILVAIGRSVRTKGIGLENAGVEVKDGKIVADAYYRTTNKNIFAIGDAYGREMFSHGAEKHNTDLWINLLSPVDIKHKLNKFTWVTFTDPEIAQFGLTKEQLDEQGINYETIEQPLEHDDRAVAADFQYGHLILYVKKGLFGGGKLLGGCMAAPAAGEMIQELHLLQTLGKKYSKLTNKIYAYPVASRINQKAARDRAAGQLESPVVARGLRAAFRLQHR